MDRLDPVRSYVGNNAGNLALLAQLHEPEALFSRSNMTGHITASGLVLTPDYAEVLLIGHKGLNKWLQPGGHVDPEDAEIWQAAAREIREETGVTAITLHPWHAEHGYQPADIDTHAIPARPMKGEGDHFHHDCLFVFIAPKAALTHQEEENTGACWCPITDERVPDRLRRVYHAVTSAPAVSAVSLPSASP